MSDHREALWDIANLCMASTTQSKRIVYMHVLAMRALGMTESQRRERLEKAADKAIAHISQRREKILAAAADPKPPAPERMPPTEGEFSSAETFDLLDGIDARIFTGEPPDATERAAIRWYTERWGREFKRMHEAEQEEQGIGTGIDLDNLPAILREQAG